MEQHEFDLLYAPGNVFGGSTYKYILIGVHVTLRYIVTRALRIKKASQITFALEIIYKKVGPFNGSEFRSDVKELLEKNNVDG